MTQPFVHLERSAKAFPQKIAVSSVDADLTYAELYDSSVRFAKAFRERGVVPGDIVGTHLPPILDLVVSEALFHEACVGAQLPIGHSAVIAATFDWVIVAQPIEGFPADRQIVVDEQLTRHVATLLAVANPKNYPNDDALCRLSFSSGTTGEPKAIPVSIDCLEDRSIDRQRQWMPEQPYLCLLGLSTGLTFMSFYAHIQAAETFILAGTGEAILDQITAHHVRCVMGSPHQLGNLVTLAENASTDFDSVNLVMSAGSVLPDALVTRLAARFGARILATYASTEAGSVAIRDGLGAFDSFAGRLLDDVDVKITDESRNPVNDGEVGYVAIKRARQPQRYLHPSDDDLTGFHDGFFFPGDLGFLRGRDLYIVGRSSEVFNAAGVKVDPARVEGVAREWAELRDAAVFGFTPPSGLQEICMFFVSDRPVDMSALATLMRSRLDESAPTKYVRVAHIERNHMGKVNRQSLSERFAQMLAHQANDSAEPVE